jgi:hypothetical protein
VTVIVDTLRQELAALASLREAAAIAAGTVKNSRTLWEEENAQTIANAQVLAEHVAVKERQVRELAVMARETTGESKPAPGIEVRASTKVTVQDAAAALIWAKASGIGHVPETIDAKAIEAAATKAKLALPFLKTETTFKALIATDLGKALASEQPAAASISEAA